MNHADHPTSSADARYQVRRNAASAAIAAVLMCAYGFGFLAAPDPQDLFSWCNLVLYYALRIGGVGFAVIAVWCGLGQTTALAADAVLSVVVGLIFMATGVGMWRDGGGVLNSVLLVVFGWMFTGVGVRNWRLFQHLSVDGVGSTARPSADEFLGGSRATQHGAFSTERESARAEARGSALPSDSLAGCLREQRGATTVTPMSTTPHESAPDQGTLVDENDIADPDDISSKIDAQVVDEPEDTTEQLDETSTPPDGGFLSSFGEDGRPPGV